jgi:hypothetical protein
MAAERERNLTDAAETAAQIDRRASGQNFGPSKSASLTMFAALRRAEH